MSRRRVRTQEVTRCAVQVRSLVDAVTRGTGALVSPRGDILTCHHVVDGLVGGGARPGDLVADVVLPPGTGSRLEFPAAFVAGDAEADLALLRVQDPPPGGFPAGSVAVIGAAGNCHLHEFVSYGFRSLHGESGGYATGRILGPLLPTTKGPRHPALQLESPQIAPGMSGAPVLDVDRNLVVGLISDTWLPDTTTKDRDTAWATDLANVALLGTDLTLASTDLPKNDISEGRPLPVDPARALAERATAFLQSAPPPTQHLRGREALLRQLDEDWDDPDVAITSLVGLGGQGKSAVLRAWVDTLLDRAAVPVHWWSFDDNPDTAEFLRSAFLHLVDGRKLQRHDLDQLLSGELLPSSLAHAARARRSLLVLDGIEAIFRADQPGRLPDDLRTLVRMLAEYPETVQCVITSRLPVLDVIDLASHRARAVGPVQHRHAAQILRDAGVQGGDEQLRELADELDGHPLSLVLAGAFIAKEHAGDPTAFRSLDDLTASGAGSDAGARVRRILEDYGRVLPEEERLLLAVLSVQRMPVTEEILDRICQNGRRRDHPLNSLSSLTRRAYLRLLDDLANLGLVMRDLETRRLSCHVFVKGYFAEEVHRQRAPWRRQFYWSIARAYLRSTSLQTLGAVGLGSAAFAGSIAVRRIKPQLLVPVSRAVTDDKMLCEGLHFLARIPIKKETAEGDREAPVE